MEVIIMKVFLKILAVAAAIAGVVAVIVIFGDKIVAWFKKLLPKCKCDGECECAETEEAVAEDFASVEEAPAEEVVVEETDAVAEEVDFEG
jgi:hypothetical protein